MSTTAASAVNSGAGNIFPDGSSRMPVQTLSQQEFLQLLVAQLSSQDPLNPQSTSEFSSQMVQFSSLEQSRTMAKDISKLNDQQQFAQATALLGRHVQVNKDKNTTIDGTVSAVQLIDGTPQLVVNNQMFDVGQVTAVIPEPVVTTAQK